MLLKPFTLRQLMVIPLCALMLVAGCAGTGNREQRRLARFSPEALYTQAQKAMRSSDYAEAVQIYEALAARYAFTPQAKQARLDVIYAYYRLGEKESAKDAAETFIRENPTHPRIDYAWYLKGLIDFERTPYSVERWMGVDFGARPPEGATDSFQALRTVVTRFPTSLYAADARRRMIYLRNRLADSELRVAQHYMERGAWVSAAQRARQVIEQYDGSPSVQEALKILIYCYDKLDYKELQENTAKVYRENFPDKSMEWKGTTSHWWKVWG